VTDRLPEWMIALGRVVRAVTIRVPLVIKAWVLIVAVYWLGVFLHLWR